MSVIALSPDLFTHLQSSEFLATAPHPLHPTAFTHQRKLPLPALVALLLTGMRKNVQGELDEFFAHLRQQSQLVHQVSAQAFAQARARLSVAASTRINHAYVFTALKHLLPALPLGKKSPSYCAMS